MIRSGLRATPFIIYLICCAHLLAQPQSGDDALQAGTVWTGHTEGDPRKPKQDRERGATLRVTAREGQRFEAELGVRGRAAFVLELEGRVSKSQVAVKVTRIVRGTWPGGTVNDVWTGTLDGETLVLKHAGKKNLVTTITLRPDADAPSRRGAPNAAEPRIANPEP